MGRHLDGVNHAHEICGPPRICRSTPTPSIHPDSVYYLVSNGMSTHERRVKNRTSRKNFRAPLVRLKVIHPSEISIEQSSHDLGKKGVRGKASVDYNRLPNLERSHLQPVSSPVHEHDPHKLQKITVNNIIPIIRSIPSHAIILKFILGRS